MLLFFFIMFLYAVVGVVDWEVSDLGKKYTDKELLEILKEYYNKHGHARAKDFTNCGTLPHYQVYSKRFGSWDNAKSLVGIPVFKRIGSYNKEILIDTFKKLVKKLNHIPSFNILEKENFPYSRLLYKYFNSYDELLDVCNLERNTIKTNKYKLEFLINEIKRFVEEFKYIPKGNDFENLEGYPSRKTFTNNFRNFNEAIRGAGFIPQSKNSEDLELLYNKESLIQLIKDYYNEFNEVPNCQELYKWHGKEVKWYYKKYFGGWNNALIEAGFPLNRIAHHSDEFLESEFHRFYQKNGRVPAYVEFNDSEYPSFWCYQNRFGSWNKAVIAYGYEPNSNFYELEDGEICRSSYEFDISKWLKSNNIEYVRDIRYDSFIDNYKGKMDCDYVINYNNKIWYVEMAGFLSDGNKLSEIERIYYFKIKYKEKLLIRQNLNYLIIKPRHLKKKTLEEIFKPIIGVDFNCQMNLNVAIV